MWLVAYNEEKFAQILGSRPHFVQDNQSQSQYGVVRGLHMQAGDHAQAKLVRVMEGKVIDVAVDVRPGSETYGHMELTALETQLDEHSTFSFSGLTLQAALMPLGINLKLEKTANATLRERVGTNGSGQ